MIGLVISIKHRSSLHIGIYVYKTVYRTDQSPSGHRLFYQAFTQVLFVTLASSNSNNNATTIITRYLFLCECDINMDKCHLHKHNGQSTIRLRN